MRGVALVFAIFWGAVAIAQGANAERTQDELKEAARKVLSQVVSVPDDCIIAVEPIGSRSKGRKVVFQMAIPSSIWTLSKYPEVHFLDHQDAPEVRAWKVCVADEKTPCPQAIAQRFLQEERDPGRCIEIMAVWFDANRNKGRIVNFEYDRYAWAYREAGKEDQWVLVLNEERKRAKAPEAIYEIYKHMALVHLSRSCPQKAIENWLLAQEAMKSQTDAYIATRYAIPYLEIARIHKQQGSLDEAAVSFERYLATPHGKRNAFEAIKLLGEIYEATHQVDKARELYLSVLAEDYGRDWASQDYIKQCQEPIRERIRALGFGEKLEPLIRDLANSDFEVRMKAYREIRKYGKEVVPILRKYQDHNDPEIRGAVWELIKNLR